ncbi:MucR family transcriptional regulator [Acidisoma cladoniae]|jgi:predicted transcriptional regulator|uniref:MucR family transcriptional regulator n=1 Tax=Acidisoma cladoniae TaxID=3040935 RepID=UPI00254E022D|nr:MucR family transcriptional regulator [Acidisoma sp. PAMC 29798]
MTIDVQPAMLVLVTNVVSAYVSGNTLPSEMLPDMIRAVHTTFVNLSQDMPTAVEARPAPAVPIKKSVFPDYIICLEDGLKLRMLRRHLRIAYGMAPHEYRQRWNLPATYPMVAPNYSVRRSDLAKTSGLGTKGPHTQQAVTVAVARADIETVETEAAARPEVTVFKAHQRGRKKVVPAD